MIGSDQNQIVILVRQNVQTKMWQDTWENQSYLHENFDHTHNWHKYTDIVDKSNIKKPGVYQQRWWESKHWLSVICNPLISQPIPHTKETNDHLADIELADSANQDDCLEVDAGTDWARHALTGI